MVRSTACTRWSSFRARAGNPAVDAVLTRLGFRSSRRSARALREALEVRGRPVRGFIGKTSTTRFDAPSGDGARGRRRAVAGRPRTRAPPSRRATWWRARRARANFEGDLAAQSRPVARGADGARSRHCSGSSSGREQCRRCRSRRRDRRTPCPAALATRLMQSPASQGDRQLLQCPFVGRDRPAARRRSVSQSPKPVSHVIAYLAPLHDGCRWCWQGSQPSFLQPVSGSLVSRSGCRKISALHRTRRCWSCRRRRPRAGGIRRS